MHRCAAVCRKVRYGRLHHCTFGSPDMNFFVNLLVLSMQGLFGPPKWQCSQPESFITEAVRKTQ